ncbi:cell division protein ZapA [Desulfogranum mediterraneum]|uniref:cell division protein ZapA n=1 Tax=Desulfogranum mediterraneum TaxID=160661 RepID=UPI00041FFEAB|nr:cell division protein ZapA [Desulfogranum mediterraneum]
MKERLVRFNLFGQEFAFYSDAPSDDVEQAITLLRQELEGDEPLGRSTIPSSKMLVLGSLRLAARCVQLEQEHQRFRETQQASIEKLVRKMSSQID